MGWIGVDLDGTLAHYDEWKGISHIGEPIDLMVRRVKYWLKEGKDVRIFTARAADKKSIKYIENWLEKVFKRTLPITNIKDLDMEELWDDRAVQVIKNKGNRVDGKYEKILDENFDIFNKIIWG